MTVVSDNREESVALGQRAIAQYVRIPAYNKHFRRIGFREQVQRIENSLKTGGIEVAANDVPAEMVDQLIVHGTTEECLSQVSEFVRARVTHPTIYPYIPSPTVLDQQSKCLLL